MHSFEISIEKDTSYITVDTKATFYINVENVRANPRRYDVNVIEIESLTGAEIERGTGVHKTVLPDFLFFCSFLSVCSCPPSPVPHVHTYLGLLYFKK